MHHHCVHMNNEKKGFFLISKYGRLISRGLLDSEFNSLSFGTVLLPRPYLIRTEISLQSSNITVCTWTMEKKIFSHIEVWPVDFQGSGRFGIQFSIDWNCPSPPAILDKNRNLSTIIQHQQVMKQKIFSTKEVWPANFKVSTSIRIRFCIHWNCPSPPAILHKNRNLSTIIQHHCVHMDNGKKDFFSYRSMAG